MLNICSFIQKFFGFIKTVSKKMYRTGLVVVSGTALFALVTMNSNSFNGAGKNGSTDSDGGTSRESVAEEDDTDETAEIQPVNHNLQNIVSYLQKDNSITKESEPIASLKAAEREHVGISSNALTGYMELLGSAKKMLDRNALSVTAGDQRTSVSAETTEKATEKQTETQPATTVAAETQTESERPVETESQTEPQTEMQTEIQTATEVQQEQALNQIYNAVGFEINDDDYYWLIRIVEAEAGDQDEIGRILVANVIFNRVRSQTFPNTVKSVIFQNNGRVYQFEPVKNERIYNVTPSQRTIDCVGRAMAGEDYSSGALYFTMRTSSNSWFNRKLRLLFVHGDHYFYAN
ncbi:MAG: cell wall hydrolase [Lachnospiraceae bacterium]|nr:cell wall hydrolase [Lachnospiraceae bacterium]